MNALGKTWGAFGAASGFVIRQVRRARGWQVESLAEFASQVQMAAATVERHPHLPSAWEMGRLARIHMLNAKMQELLYVTCGVDIRVDCMCDSLGAIGECYLGEWVVPFRIDLDPARWASERKA